jgi:cell division protease FtsH
MRTRSELRDEMAMLMGGRTAEELIFGDPTTGAQNDIERATQIARAMVTQFGMSDQIGPLQLGNKHGEVFLGKEMGHEVNYSDDVASAIDAEIRRLVDDAHVEAREVLSLHRATLDQLADALVAHETLGDDQLHAIFGHLDSWETTPSSIDRERATGPGRGRVTGTAGSPSIPDAGGRSDNVTAAEGDTGSWKAPGTDDHRPDVGPPRFP